MSIISKNLIENPFAKIKNENIFAPYFIGLIFFVPVISSGFYVRSQIVSASEEIPANNYVESEFYKGSNAYVQTGPTNISKKRFISVKKDRSISSLSGCSEGVVDDKISFCELGDKRSPDSILLVGGSRLAHWDPLFSYLGKEKGIKIIAATIHSCSFGYHPSQSPECLDWNDKIIPFISNMNPRPKMVVINSSRSEHESIVREFGVKSGEYIPSGYIDNIKEVLSLGIPVVGIRINPLSDHPNSCLWRNMEDASKCTVKYRHSLLEKNPALALNKEDLKGFYPVDFTSVMCREGLCPLVFDGYPTMTDDTHFTGSYISYLAPALEESLNNQVGGLSNILKK